MSLTRGTIYDENFRSMNRVTVETINIITGSNLMFDDSEEVIDMCKAIQDIRNSGIKEGMEKGIEKGILTGRIEQFIETSKEYGADDRTIISGLMKKFKLTEQEAKLKVTG